VNHRILSDVGGLVTAWASDPQATACPSWARSGTVDAKAVASFGPVIGVDLNDSLPRKSGLNEEEVRGEKLEPTVGVEPTTCALRMREPKRNCSEKSALAP